MADPAPAPAPGQLGVFDRSHYEDVVTVRVQKLADARTWRRRYDAINRFEDELAAGGTRIVKCFLHISQAEQRARLLRRLDDGQALEVRPVRPRRARAVGRVHRRLLRTRWSAAAAISRRGTSIPADRKWYRNWAVGELLLDQLEALALRWPEPAFDIDEMRRRLLAMP